MQAINLLIKPVSSSCNMKCKYCFYYDVASKRTISNYGKMSYDTQARMIETAFSSADKVCNFSFQGGEPTLAGLEYFVRHVTLVNLNNNKNILVTNSIQTNGYLIDEKWAKFFAENNFLVGISLDGQSEMHNENRVDSDNKGTYNKVMRTIRLLEKYSVEYNVLTVVTNKQSKRINRLMNFYQNNNLKYIQFIPCLEEFDTEKPLINQNLTVSEYTKFLKSTFDYYYRMIKTGNYISIRNFDNYIRMVQGKRPESCGMSGVCTCYFLVESNGNVYPCDFYVLDKYLLGNLNKTELKYMVDTSIAKNFIQESKYIHNECRKCKWFFICRGGCKRYREPFIDGLPGLNKYCESYKEFFEYSYKRMKEIAMKYGN